MIINLLLFYLNIGRWTLDLRLKGMNDAEPREIEAPWGNLGHCFFSCRLPICLSFSL
jgi:hypothetical protein